MRGGVLSPQILGFDSGFSREIVLEREIPGDEDVEALETMSYSDELSRRVDGNSVLVRAGILQRHEGQGSGE